MRHCVKKTTAERWDNFVSSHPHGSIYHTTAWHRVIENTYGYAPSYHVVETNSGEIRSGIACTAVRNLFTGKRLVAYPFSDHCDLLLGKAEDETSLLQALQAQAKRSNTRRIELRGYRQKLSFKDLAADSNCQNHVLPVDDDLPQIFSRFHKSCIQRRIRRAENQGVVVKTANDDSGLHQFYRLHLLTRRKLGVPSQPLSFFRNLLLELAPPGRLTLLLAFHAKSAVAAMILLHYKSRTYYKFGASDPDRLWLGGNALLFWRAVQIAKERDAISLELGRTGQADAGLATFKERLGGVAENLVYFSSPLTKKRTVKLAGAASCLLRQLPAGISQLSGRLLYKYLA